MDILIVGGTRFVGYFLTWRLLAAGHCVTLDAVVDFLAHPPAAPPLTYARRAEELALAASLERRTA